MAREMISPADVKFPEVSPIDEIAEALSWARRCCRLTGVPF